MHKFMVDCSDTSRHGCDISFVGIEPFIPLEKIKTHLHPQSTVKCRITKCFHLQEELASLDPATLEQQLPEILQIFEAEVEQAEAGQELEYREPGEEQPLQEEEEGSGEMVFDYTGDPM